MPPAATPAPLVQALAETAATLLRPPTPPAPREPLPRRRPPAERSPFAACAAQPWLKPPPTALAARRCPPRSPAAASPPLFSRNHRRRLLEIRTLSLAPASAFLP